MANLRISAASSSNLTNNYNDVTVNSAEQDAPGTTYTPEWSKWFGYYKVIPELQAVIDKKALWAIGKGYKADEATQAKLDKIRGNGKDSFNTILANLMRAATICGDSFAEIIKDSSGRIKNIKPLNPGSISIISNESGIISGYEQNIYPTGKKIPFKTDEIFHLSLHRLGDECHGISTIQKIERIILARNEAFEDMKTVFHRYVSPINLWELDSDNESEVSTFITKVETTYKNKEHIFIPKGTAELKDRLSIPQYSTLDPLPWIQMLNQYFLMAEGVPEVILGYGRDTTEASSKTMYLAFQQVIEWAQLYLEEQVKIQLNLEIELEFPENIAANMQETAQKNSDFKNTKEDMKAKL